jgi:hypothetical protein
MVSMSVGVDLALECRLSRGRFNWCGRNPVREASALTKRTVVAGIAAQAFACAERDYFGLNATPECLEAAEFSILFGQCPQEIRDGRAD